MDQINGIGTIELDEERTILMPCILVDEDNQLWIHFLDQTHVMMLGWDRAEVCWVEFIEGRNAVICTIYPRFGGIPPIKVFMCGLNWKSLKTFCDDPWCPSEGLVLSESDDDTSGDDTSDNDETADTTEPMDTETDSVEDAPEPRKGWFSWLW